MKLFSKKEFKAILIIFVFLILVCIPGFRESLMLSRDLQRKNDFWDIYSALSAYHEDFGVYPLSQDSKILACKKPDTEVINDPIKGYIVDYIPCEWGGGSITNVLDESKTPYIKDLPADPQADKGLYYVYLSNGTRYQLYASLESSKQDEFSLEIKNLNINCGKRVCNFGRSPGKTPLDKSIEEYENELNEKNK
ncbi:hypothetical protein ACFL1Q_00295 [Patescibacteria group bacterium]